VHHFDLDERELPEVKAGGYALSALWVPVTELASMEDGFVHDHFHMLDHFLGLTGDVCRYQYNQRVGRFTKEATAGAGRAAARGL
jgi:hypothetical protein